MRPLDHRARALVHLNRPERAACSKRAGSCSSASGCWMRARRPRQLSQLAAKRWPRFRVPIAGRAAGLACWPNALMAWPVRLRLGYSGCSQWMKGSGFCGEPSSRLSLRAYFFKYIFFTRRYMCKKSPLNSRRFLLLVLMLYLNHEHFSGWPIS